MRNSHKVEQYVRPDYSRMDSRSNANRAISNSKLVKIVASSQASQTFSEVTENQNLGFDVIDRYYSLTKALG